MFRFLDSVRFAIERLWQYRVLVFWALVGLTAATTLALSLPLYVDAVNSSLLTSRLSTPPYAFLFRYLGSWKGNITPADVSTTTTAMTNTFTGMIALPTELTVNFMRGSAWGLRLTNNNNNANLGAFSLGTLDGSEKKMNIVAGEWPPAQPTNADDPLPILISEKMLYKMGLQVGDNLTTTPPGGKPLKLRVVALWKPYNANDPSWIFPPKFFDEILLLRAEDLDMALQGLNKPVEEAAWYLSFDGATVKTADVAPLLNRITDGQRMIDATLPGIRLQVSPTEKLTLFSNDVSRLTQQLVIMVLPVGGLVLYFVSLVAGLLVMRQQTEDVTLRSRGMSRGAILGIHFLMWLILAGVALGIGIFAAPYLVRLVGQTTSFLRFDNPDAPLTVIFTPMVIAAGAATGVIAASSGLLLAWRTTRQTITSFKRQSARGSRAWWQRLYLDVMLLIPAYYVLFTLTQRGGLATTADDPFSDPVVFLGPTLFALGNTLLFLRLWPMLMRFSARIVSIGSGIAILMALRELTRSIGRYRGALLMMCFTLSLIGFTASMASTLDRSLEDTIDYRVGADAVLITATDAQTEESTDSSGQTTQNVTGFNTLPVDDLVKLEGIYAVSRVGRYPAQLRLPSKLVDGTALGIDRATMASVAKFRGDYAQEPLADLMNKLAGNRTGILLSAKTAEQYKLRVNQVVTYQVQALNQWYEAKVPIVGLIDYFPSLNPNDGKFFLITSIEPIWEMVGVTLPYDIWLSVTADANIEQIKTDVHELGYPVIEWKDPRVELHIAKTGAARRGVLGFLSVGFIASIVLTLVGSIIQNAASFKAQSIQLGSLRAMGLGSFKVGVYLIVSQGLAVTSGILGGTGIGAATTLLFLPLLDFSAGLPPYLVRVAWDEIYVVYALFAGVLFAVTIFTTFLLGRQSASILVKLGDSA